MNVNLPHISICICTYKRPELLARLFNDLAIQITESLFTYSIVVIDNDQSGSARPVVEEFLTRHNISVVYCIEPIQGIALVRNRAVAEAKGDYLAFIDDDEFPIKEWLHILFKTLQRNCVDGVLGPVKPQFDVRTPAWVIKGRFYDRVTYPTGFVIDWTKGRTGNVLFRRNIFVGMDQPFNKDFPTGEDQDFFRRMIEKGYRFIWCNEAIAFEAVPPSRWKRSFMLRRALLRGMVSLRHPTFGAKDILKSLMALPLYSVLLPFLLFGGQHRFMEYLIRSFDHLGRLLAFVGIHVVSEKYVTE